MWSIVSHYQKPPEKEHSLNYIICGVNLKHMLCSVRDSLIKIGRRKQSTPHKLAYIHKGIRGSSPWSVGISHVHCRFTGAVTGASLPKPLWTPLQATAPCIALTSTAPIKETLTTSPWQASLHWRHPMAPPERWLGRCQVGTRAFHILVYNLCGVAA